MENESAILILPLGHEEICRLLPHRYPFLLVDSIVAWEPRTRVVGLKNVSANEEFFSRPFSGLSGHARRADYRSYGASRWTFSDGIV